jgi:hypothetical protein
MLLCIHCLILCIQKGWTPLLIACAEGCVNVVKELLQHQIQLEIENNVSQQKVTSCHVTQYIPRLRRTYTLHHCLYIMYTAYNIYQEGRTALLVACWQEHHDIVHQLLVAGASPNAQDQVSGCS